MNNYKTLSVLVTGGRGFIGKHLTNQLEARGAKIIDTSAFGDLLKLDPRSIKEEVDIVIHLAGYNGGIAFNQSWPFDIFSVNSRLALCAVELALHCKAKTFVGVLTSCGYPPDHGSDITEDTYLEGRPHFTISSHGYAKRNLLIACQFAQAQYGLNAICLCPNTVYGPGDCLDPTRTKVMMAMIKRFVDARRNNLHKVSCWGTGAPVREFIFVKDLAYLIAEATLCYRNPEKPLNLSTGQSISVMELAKTVARQCGYSGDISWDASKPDGQSSKILNSTQMRQLFPNFRETPLVEGISQTIDWYESLSKI
jgi:GDP-L-fucose synthase